uniref:TGF-beta propeptide domain-containing protein n=1 Tax=Pavo cristatus TaxID=9049 RepID=A0A8C9FBQ9_PAVCR
MRRRGCRGESSRGWDGRAMLGAVLLLLALARPASPESRRAEALKKLLEVFGMEDPPPPPAHVKQPPQYMVDLFNTVANADGVTKNPDVLEGNTVRSFLDRTHGEKMRFLFVLSSVAKNEKILTAELHLFRLWPRATEGPRRHHFCQVSVYQILDKTEPDSPEGQKLLATRLLSLQGSGWEVFAITQAVRDWTQDESSNRGLLVTVHGLGGSALEAPAVQFASSGDHHESKKPMLVLFTDDGRRGASLPVAGVPGGCHTAWGRAQVPACRLWLSLNVAVLRAVPVLMSTVGLQSCHLCSDCTEGWPAPLLRFLPPFRLLQSLMESFSYF